MEISEPIDITYAPSSTVPGLVAPFLVADQAPLLRPEDKAWYIGDGVTPTTVTGSPCGTNFIRVTAVGLDGVTPIPINTANNPDGDAINVYTSRLFTVSGKRAPMAEVPLSIGAAYFSRSNGIERVTVMAEGSASATQLAGADVTINGASLPPATAADDATLRKRYDEEKARFATPEQRLALLPVFWLGHWMSESSLRGFT
jgi:hypothetical protein